MKGTKTHTTAHDVLQKCQQGAQVNLQGFTKNNQFEKWDKPLSNRAKQYITKKIK